uniref:Cilia- and flagella-associated protein 418 n=1 Tax=Amphiprion ocellaris TaxID=80972 RepID=A0AAQ5ZE21_AMPOC
MADDDLDELLDEVEKKFCRDVSVACSARVDPSGSGKYGRDKDGQRKHSVPKPKQPISSVSEDIDALLEELREEDPRPKTELCPKGSQVEKKLPPQSAGRKCCPVYVGGSSVTNGVGTATSKRSCDQLRCISCDFKVLMFDDCEWDPSCDYLFLSRKNRTMGLLKRRRKTRKTTAGVAERWALWEVCSCCHQSVRKKTEDRKEPH